MICPVRNKVPQGQPGRCVLYIERPGTFNFGQRDFNKYERRPAELHNAMSVKDWAQFSAELNEIVDRFWNELVPYVPIIIAMVAFYPITAFMAGVVSLDNIERQTMTSDGSELRPHCSWENECFKNVAVELACTSKLCRAAGYNHGLLLNRSNDFCRSTLPASIPTKSPTYMVFWDRSTDWGPLLYDNTVKHGLSASTVECVRDLPPPAWTCMAVFGTIPALLLFSIIPLRLVNSHNKRIDQEIYELVQRANARMPPGAGCGIEYASDFTYLCKPSGVRPWRALIVHGNPGRGIPQNQRPPSE